jgi:uncharacterized SAM-binding protein YcdF (DUF218 family)
MFFSLSKILYVLVMPLTIACYPLVYALFTKNPRRQRRALLLGLGLLYVFSNEYLTNAVLAWWERPPTVIAESEAPYDVAIVLTGGIINERRQLPGRVLFDKSADRLLQPLQLYRHGRVRKILISGGTFEMDSVAQNEREAAARQFLIDCGVREADVLWEHDSRNTRENAVNSAKVLRREFPGQRYLLITSAFHMRRAEGCFRKAGVRFKPYPADIRSGDNTFRFDVLFPKEEALATSFFLVREWIGYVTYKVMGYC